MSRLRKVLNDKQPDDQKLHDAGSSSSGDSSDEDQGLVLKIKRAPVSAQGAGVASEGERLGFTARRGVVIQPVQTIQRPVVSLGSVVARGNLDEVKRLIESGVNIKEVIDHPRGGKTTALKLALENKQEDIALFLIERDNKKEKIVNFDYHNRMSNWDGYSFNYGAMKLAVENDCAKVVEYGINKGFNIRFVDYYSASETLLHLAAMYNSVNVINYLVQNGADINAAAYYGYYRNRTPLCTAILGYKKEAIEALLKAYGDDKIDIPLEFILESIKNGCDKETFSKISEKNSNDKEDINRLLSDVIRCDNDKIVRFLLDSNKIELEGQYRYCAEDDAHYERERYKQLTPLQMVIVSDYLRKSPKVTKLLLERGADINKARSTLQNERSFNSTYSKYYNFLSSAVDGMLSGITDRCNAGKDLAIFLLRNGIEKLESHHLNKALGGRDDYGQIAKIMNVLIENMGDVRVGDLLLCAAKRGEFPVVEYFWQEYGENLGIKDKNGDTALHLLLQSKNCSPYKVKRLAEINPGLINAKNALNQTPLHCLLISDANYDYSKKKIINSLLDIAGDIGIDSVDNSGNNVLHAAIQGNCSTETIDKLLTRLRQEEKIAEVIDAKNNFGQTPLELALSAASQETIDLLSNNDLLNRRPDAHNPLAGANANRVLPDGVFRE